MSYEKIVTLFDTTEHAEAARRNLETSGFASDDISMIGRQELPSGTLAIREPGLWHRLLGRDVEEDEARIYGNAIDAGGSVLTVRTRDADVPKALDILNQRAEMDAHRAMESGFLLRRTATPASSASEASLPARPLISDIGTGEMLRLAEEQFEVGKRLVTGGTTRIRRFVTESPAEAQVKLHEEHIEIVRRTAADPNYVRDIDWTDRTFEFTDTAEEAVVNKSVHVAEEVMIGKKASDHVETVRGTVRRQHVEVERAAGERERDMELPHKEDWR